ncbi:tail protein X [Endozoicomonas sp. SM1973]|uniref:Tail protein X n=1 Tax=Spartinivicinus marinus TaxID=2994442 RepID=A0A853IHD9_9GAMM|nr:tail protein X [Spartinivicinus marinus]MCX4025155.1 tail protein X [Spartinivicinus marinus]NYZ69928.1 tail protein X [Spartinivicinus marinus]
MATIYRTKDGDTLDWICKQYYGDEAFVLQVLDANPRLVEQGPVLVAGINILLPALTPQNQTVEYLWS